MSFILFLLFSLYSTFCEVMAESLELNKEILNETVDAVRMDPEGPYGWRILLLIHLFPFPTRSHCRFYFPLSCHTQLLPKLKLKYRFCIAIYIARPSIKLAILA